MMRVCGSRGGSYPPGNGSGDVQRAKKLQQ
jgi:hypothetical protein